MTKKSDFGRLLKRAVKIIDALKDQGLGFVKEELAQELDYAGPNTIDYWIRGNIPAEPKTVEKLAKVLFKQGGLDCKSLQEFLTYADLDPKSLLTELCPATEPPPEPPNPPLKLNPFVVGIPITIPKQFFGCEEILTKTFHLWRRYPLHNAAIVGARRTGKTSLLHYVKNITVASPVELRPGQKINWLPAANHFQWVFVDFQEEIMRYREPLLGHILRELKLDVPEPCNQANFNRVMREQLHKPTVILMDEFNKAVTAPDSELGQSFWEDIRALIGRLLARKNSQYNLAFVLAAQQRPDQLAQHKGITSPFFNYFQYFTLSPFTEREACELIDSSPLPFPTADKEWILTHIERWAYELQICCYCRFAALEDGKTDDAWKDDALAEISRFKEDEYE